MVLGPRQQDEDTEFHRWAILVSETCIAGIA